MIETQLRFLGILDEILRRISYGEVMKIAHLSDLHFSKPEFGPGQIFSKRWLGTANLLINRRKVYCNKRPFDLIPFLKAQGVELCLYSGDFTSTGSAAEYQLAQEFAKALKAEHIRLMAIPGNHDTYTKENEKQQTFYQYFPGRYWTSTYSLSEHRCTNAPLTDGWWIVAMDTTLSTSLISSGGRFPESLEPTLEACLKEVPKDQKILLMNHFPFFQHENKRRRMERGQALEALIRRHPRIQLYLHGHTHRRCLADLRSSGLPVVLDPSSTGQALSAWNCLNLTKDRCDITVFGIQNESWHRIQQESILWKNGTQKG